MEGLKETGFTDVVNGLLGETQKEQLYKIMLPVVVKLKVLCLVTNEFIELGIGVIISPTGLILTLSDVVSHYKNSFIALTSDNGKYFCDVEHLDPNSGLALLKVRERVSTPYAKVSERVTICEQVYSIGEIDNSFHYSIGQVSYLSREYMDVRKALDVGLQAREYLRGSESIEDTWISKIADPAHISSSLLQLNNLHGWIERIGMPIFNYSGHVIGLYVFTSNDQCFAINAKSITSYLSTQVATDGDIPGSLRGTDEKEKKRRKRRSRRREEKRIRKEELKEGTNEEEGDDN